jgi:tRNA(Ile)-lysidine synthase
MMGDVDREELRESVGVDLAQLVWDRAQALAPGTARWAVATSGGGDSLALADMLRRCGADITILHIDHGLRGDSSEDARHVEALAAAWGVPFAAEVVAVRAALGRSDNLEAVARKLRRVTLHRLARAAGADVLLLAHTLDDQAETVILQALRGSATLRGMPERQGRMLRPMLGVSRNELRAYLDQHQLRWREDPTNHDLERARAWVRYAVLPRLEAYAPGVTHRLARLAGQQQALAAFVATEARRRIPGLAAVMAAQRPFAEDADAPQVDVGSARAAAEGLEVATLLQQPLALQREALAALLRAAGVEVDLQRVERVRERLRSEDATPWRGSVGSKRWWRVAYGRVAVVGSDGPPLSPPMRSIERPEDLPAGVDTRLLADGPLIYRTRRPGDVVHLPGGHRSLADVLIDAKVPREERDHRALLARGEEVVWVEGVIDATPEGSHLHRDPEEVWMGEALLEAAAAAAVGELPVGAVLVCDGEIVARAHNRSRRDHDPTAHAEVLVLRLAAAARGDWRLPQSTLVVTLEPCPMCFGALLAAHVGRVVFGAPNLREGAFGGVANLPSEGWKRKLSVRGGVRAQEAGRLLSGFFAARRTP